MALDNQHADFAARVLARFVQSVGPEPETDAESIVQGILNAAAEETEKRLAERLAEIREELEEKIGMVQGQADAWSRGERY